MRRCFGQLVAFVVLFAIGSGCQHSTAKTKQESIRFATFNVSLYRSHPGQLYEDLKAGDEQARSIAAIIQRQQPDILLLNEFDFDPELSSAQLFIDDYLAEADLLTTPVTYPYFFTSSVNTGVPSGFDFDNDGKISGPTDAFGYGRFPGQYGMVLLSKYPIKVGGIRTFQHFLWKDMPAALLPDNPDTIEMNDWYSREELEVFRLSSKNHWDVPVAIGNETVHLLISHPTPPVFDGPEDRNGRRNHDEIRFWADYISSDKSGYIYDDNGRRGGLAAGALFVIMGDLNADPERGDSTHRAIGQLLSHRSIYDPEPSTQWAVDSAIRNKTSKKYKMHVMDTYYSVMDKGPGNLRLDYVLPSCTMKVVDSGVFWSLEEDWISRMIHATDHRMVYVDIQIDGSY